MINGRNIYNSDRKKNPNKLALNVSHEKAKVVVGRIKINFKVFTKAWSPHSSKIIAQYL